MDSLLQSAQSDLNTLLRRNLDHNPELKELYIERFGKAACDAL